MQKTRHQSKQPDPARAIQLTTLQCDKRSGACGQCTRAHVVCPGYADPESLVFRDETKRVARKVSKGKKTGPESRRSVPVNTIQSPSEVLSGKEISTIFRRNRPSSTVPSFAPRSFPISATLEERAKSFFICTHSSSPLLRDPGFATLQSLTTADPPFIALHLLFAARAVSLASLSKHHYFPCSIMETARSNYGMALKLTQDTVFDHQRAMENSTLVTVLFLYVFEKLMACAKAQKGDSDRRRTSQEARHLEGALSLTKLRSESSFDDELARSTFRQLTSSVLTNCLERGIDVPGDLIAVREVAANSRDTSGVRWRFEEIVIRLVTLLAGRKHGVINDDQASIVAFEVDNECLQISQLLQGHPRSLTAVEIAATSNAYEAEEWISLRMLTQLAAIRLVLSEITASSLPSTLVRSGMGSLCRFIYEAAIKSSFFVASQMFLFSLYTAARSPLCPYSLSQQIKKLITKYQDSNGSRILRLLEKREGNSMHRTMGETNNPWAEFAEEGLGDLSVIGT